MGSIPSSSSSRRDACSRRDAWFSALFVITLALVVPLDAALAVAGVSLPGRKPFATRGSITFDQVLHGGAGRALEGRAVNRSHVARWLAAHVSEATYRLARRAAPVTWVGKDRWVFRPFAVRDHKPAAWSRMVSASADIVVRVGRDLEPLGGSLLVVLVPCRARIYPDQAYADGHLPAGKQAFLPTVAQALRDRGVDVIDVTDALAASRRSGRQPFYADDFHWTSAGAQASAKAVAGHALERVGDFLQPVAPRPPYEVIWYDAAPSDAAIVHRLGFMPNGRLEQSFTTVAPRASFRGTAATAWNASCATYWGSSLAGWGSPQFFANEVRCPVRVQCGPGRFFVRKVMDDLQSLRQHGPVRRPHLVVWEIPEDHLQLDRHGSWNVTMRTLGRHYGVSLRRSVSTPWVPSPGAK